MFKLFKSKRAPAQPDKIPQHIAFICDGNRRWAENRGLPPLMGHQAGIANFENLVDWFMQRGVSTITFYIFSTENWKRSKTEVSGLMKLLSTFISQKREKLVSDGIRFKVIGRRNDLPC